jgi:hypothetical protein
VVPASATTTIGTGITITTGIGIIKQIADEADYLTSNQ